MTTFSARALCFLCIGCIGGCATVTEPPVHKEAPVPRSAQRQAQKNISITKTKRLKRKIAIGRFTNETPYGRTLFRDQNLDPLGKQASDMLMSRLVQSGDFLVFERPDLVQIKSEQQRAGESNLIGVDTLILGSITEFGRYDTGKAGFLSSTKKQNARAKVEIRLVDVRTGHAFFSAEGTGEASAESGRIAGYGSKASYDETLNARAIGAAISSVVSQLIEKLKNRPWRTDILESKGDLVYISGGKQQGIKIGDILRVMREGDKVKSRQTGFEITLPATEVGQVKVIRLFGDSEENEGSVTQLIAGSMPKGKNGSYFVTSSKREQK